MTNTSQNVSGTSNVGVAGEVSSSQIATSGGIAAGRDIYIQQERSDPHPYPHQLRAPVGDFVGREKEIDELKEVLTSGSGAAVICGIRGMGGIGKTELAFAVAARLWEQHFPDAQIVVELQGEDASAKPLTPKQALQDVIHAFEPQAQLPDDLPKLTSRYHNCLHNKRVLILADNAHNVSQVRHLIPPTGSSVLLITSRQHIELPAIHILNLNILAEDGAENMLRTICPRIESNAPRLAKLCGYLPLALRVSATFLKLHTRSVEAYIETLSDEQARLSRLRDANDPMLNVEASFLLSYNMLTDDTQQAFAQLSVFAGSFTQDAAERVIQVHTQQTDELLDELCLNSLLNYDESTARYNLHDLVRLFALERLKENENPAAKHAAHLSHARYYVQVAVEAEEKFKRNTTDGLTFFDKESTNVHAAWRWLCEQPMTEEIAYLLIRYIDEIPYIAELRSASPDEHITTIDAAIEATRFLQDGERESIALARKGRALYRQGKKDEALEWLKQALGKAEEIDYNRGIGLACANLGSVYYRIDQSAKGLKKVIDWYKRAIDIKYTQDERSLAETQNNLGLTYCDVGKIENNEDYFKEARRLHDEALHIARELQDRLLECKVLNGFGIIEYTAGNLDEAISYQKQARELAKDIDPREEGHAVRWLGEIYKAKGDYKQAQLYYEKALVLMKQTNDERLIEEVELCLQHVQAQAGVSNE